MKKIISILLVIVMLFSLCACGGSKEESSAPSSQGGNVPAPSNEEIGEVNIKFGSNNNGNHPLVRAINECFKPRVEELSGGKMTVTVYDSATLGEDQAMFEQLQLGTLEMMIIGSVMSSFYPKWDIVTLPYLFENEEEADRILMSEYGKELQNELGDLGVVGLGSLEMGFRQLSNSKRPVNSLKDVKGLKIRVPNGGQNVNVMKAFGANATPMASSEVYSALQQGVVDGQENPFSSIVSMSYYDVQSHIAVTNHLYSASCILAGKNWYDALSAKQQEIIETAIAETMKYQREISREANDDNIQTCIDKGVEITYPDLAEFAAAVQPIYDEFYKAHPEYKELIEEILEAKKG